MTPQQVAAVQSTWERVVPISDTAASLFYGRLFALDPKLARMFPADMTEQRRRVMTMIGVAVRGLTRIDTLVPVLRNLGARHAGYGVRDEHYALVGAALLWTLEQGLGPAFTDEAREAWTVAYGVIATTMQEGALEASSSDRLAA